MYQELGPLDFNVVTNFIKPPPTPEDIWVGGKQKTDELFVRIVVNYIAYHLPNEDALY
jgi:hypothetical protein